MKRKLDTSITKVKSSNSSESSGSDSEGGNKSKSASADHHQKSKRQKLEGSNHNGNETSAKISVRLENTNSLTKYRNKNSHIKIEHLTTSSNFDATEISDGDEFWICEIPTTIDVNQLIGKSVKLGNRKSSFSTDGGEIGCISTKFDDTNEVYQNTVSLVFQNKSELMVKNIKPDGRLTLHTKIDSEPSIELNEYSSGRHECTVFPDNLVVRHPLLGRKFEDKINVRKDIKEKLNDAQKATESVPSVRIKQEKKNDTGTPKKTKQIKTNSSSAIMPSEKIKTENGHDDDLDRIKHIFETRN